MGNEPYKNTVLKSYEGPKPWPSWLQKIDETVTRFTYRNFGWVFGMDITPSSIVPAMEPGRLISMSEYGVYYSNTDQKIDRTLFLVSAFSSVASLSAAKNVLILNTKTTSGIELKSTPNRTTTILGRYESDTSRIIDELKLSKTVDFSGNKGGFNLLNTPDELYKTPSQFWKEYNKPFLDAAIERGDRFLMSTPCTKDNLFIQNTNELTGYGREFYYLRKRGYELVGNEMIKVVK